MRNPFWSDPIDPEADPVCCDAAATFLSWEPVRRQRINTAVWTYVALWALDVFLIIQWYNAETDGNGAESVAIPAGLLFVAQIFVVPAVLLWYALRGSQKMSAAKSAVRRSSIARYEQWLAALQANDPHLFSQIMLWHQGEEARRLQQTQIGIQLFNTFQLHQISRGFRR